MRGVKWPDLGRKETEMATASEYGLKVGETYPGRKGSSSPSREIIWITADGGKVQYDSAAVRLGQKYPTVTADAFARWAGIDCPA